MHFLAFLPWNLTMWQWGLVALSALCVGISKTGVSGATSVMVPVLAMVFGAKTSTGVLLPMLCFADLLAIIWYRKAAIWKYIGLLMPWTIAGIVVALLVARFIPEKLFKILMGCCILVGLVVMLWRDFVLKSKTVPSSPAFAGVFGVLGGFSTMIGNAAGPVMSVFMLSMRLPKVAYAGTTAWFFMIVNYLKLPLQGFVWHNISVAGLKTGAMMIPFILVGAVLGILIVKFTPEKIYRIVIYAATLVSTVLLFVF
jgi:uncharacterized membrane protein YfcA